MIHIYVDADACPVKQEVYRVAPRFGAPVTLVANSWMQVPSAPWIRLEVVASGADAADDWIVEHVQAGDLVITADILLAARCLERKAGVLGPTGKPFDDENIGSAVATRELMADLREAGERTGGPPPIGKRERSRFLQKLDEVLRRLERTRA